MREIKFRAWDKGCLRYWWNVQNAYDMLHNHDTPDEDGEKENDLFPSYFGEVLKEDNYIVEQFTGLKDKNGKEIYEGDIIKNDNGTLLLIYFDEHLMQFRQSTNLKTPQEDYHEQIHTNMPLNFNNKEIISNIHENSELLEDNHGN